MAGNITNKTDTIEDELLSRTPPKHLLSNVHDFHQISYFEQLHLLDTEWHKDEYFKPIVAVLSLCMLLGLVGNFLVILSYIATSRRKKTPMTVFVGLAFSDIIFLLVCIPHKIISKMRKDVAGIRLICKAGWFVDMATTCGSIFCIVALSFERYIVIVHPLKSRAWCSKHRIYYSLIVFWVLGALISSPFLYIQDAVRLAMYNDTAHVVTVTCVDYQNNHVFNLVFNWLKFNLMFLLPLIIFLFCYICIIKVLWKSNRQILGSNAEMSHVNHTVQKQSRTSPKEGFAMKMRENDMRDNLKNKNAIESRKQVIKILIVTIIVFFICFAPRYTLDLIKVHHSNISYDILFNFELVFDLLPFVHATLQPVIYTFLSSVFRKGLLITYTSLKKKIQRCFKMCGCLKNAGCSGRSCESSPGEANEASSSFTQVTNGIRLCNLHTVYSKGLNR